MTFEDTLKKYIEDSGLSFRQNSRSFIFTCPKCSKKNKLYISRQTGRFICFYCAETENFKGKCEYALSELLSVPVRDVKLAIYGDGEVAAKDNIDLGLIDPYEFSTREEEFGFAIVDWPEDYRPILEKYSQKGADYLAGRGIPLDIAAQYGIRYSQNYRRVAFPVEQEGYLLGWQARLVIPDTWTDPETGEPRVALKILSSPGIPREHVFMFGDRLKGSSHAIITEGPVDAIKCSLLGGNVAAMGKAITSRQLSYLHDDIKRVYLAVDPDAMEEVPRLTKALYDRFEVYLMVPPKPYKDLGEMKMEDVPGVFDSAERVHPGRVFFFFKNPY